MAPVDTCLTGGGLTRLSVTISEFTSCDELLSDTEVSALFTDNVLSDILLVPSRFFSILDEEMDTMLVRISDFAIRDVKLFTKLAEVEIVAELIRVIKSVIVDLDSACSVSIPESNRPPYALNELSLEFSERSMSLSSYGLEVEGRSYLEVEG